MKKRLTDAALELMWENSYGTTSVDAICERAGAKKGSFYYFFKSKSELTAAALEAEWNKNKRTWTPFFLRQSRRSNGSIGILIMCMTIWPNFKKQCGSILGCPMLSIGSEVSTQDQGVRATVDRIWDRKINYFESAIRDAHAQGLIVAPDPEAKARALFACYHGTLAQARIQNDVELLRDFKQVAMDVLGVKHTQACFLIIFFLPIL